MKHKKPGYKELETRLAEAENIIDVLKKGQADAVVSTDRITVLRLREAEQALKDSEQRYRSFIENNPDAVFCLNTAGRFTEANPAALRLSGYTEEQLVTKTCETLCDPEYTQKTRTHIDICLKGDTAEWQAVMIRQDKKHVDLRLTAGPLMAQGKINGIFLIAQDITPLKQTETELRSHQAELEQQNIELRTIQEQLIETRDQYHDLYEWAPNGYLTLDEGSVIRQANLAASNLLRKDRAQLIGLRIETLAVPEDRDACCQHLKNVTVTGQKQRTEIRFQGVAGTVFWGLIETLPISSVTETAMTYRMAITDITDRKQTEEALIEQKERLRLATASGQVGLWEYDLRTGKAVWSDYLYALLGRDRTASVTSDTFFDYIHEQDYHRLRHHVEHFFKNGGDFADEFRIHREDGKVRWLASAGHVYTDEAGRPVKAMGVNYDITERKQAEEALVQAEKKYREIVQYAPSGIYEIDFREKCFTQVNDVMCRMLGYSEEEMLNIDPFSLLDEKSRRRFHARLDKWIKGEEPDRDVEYRIRTRDGRLIDVLLNVTFTADENGNPLGATVVGHDITERKQAETERERLLAERTAITEHMMDGLTLADPQGNVVYHNRASLALHGYKSIEEAMQTKEQVIEQWQLSDLEGNTIPVEEWPMPRVLRGETFSRYELHVRKKENGKSFIGSYSGKLICNAAGKSLFAMLIVRDVTKQKQGEQALARERVLLQRIVDNIPVMLVMWDPNLEAFILNKHAEKVLGYTNTDANQGDFLKMVYPDPAYRKEVIGFMQALQPQWQELEPTAKNHEKIPSAWTNLQLDDDTMIGIGIDLRERKRAEEKLHHINETLEHRIAERTAEVQQQADQLRGLASQLSRTEQRERKRLAGVLHDHIQQLIVASQMRLGVIEEENDLQKRREKVNAVDGFLKEAVQALRSLSVELFPPALHMMGLTGALNWLAADMEEKNQFMVRVRTEEKAEPATEEMRILLFECVRELMFNVIKHAGVQEAEVMMVRTPENAIQIIISDKGKGFNPEVIKKRKTGDLTFGLFSIQQRLSHIGGQMDIDSEPGKGTRVTLTTSTDKTTPFVKEEKTAAVQPMGKKTVRARQKKSLIRLLIVDDHIIMREGLTGLLRFEPDIEVIGEASDGEQAVSLANKLRPDVIIMDVNLGKMNGVEATRRILEKNPDIKVIGLSLHADRNIKEAMLKAGAVDYLTKGGPAKDLIHSIHTACE